MVSVTVLPVSRPELLLNSLALLTVADSKRPVVGLHPVICTAETASDSPLQLMAVATHVPSRSYAGVSAAPAGGA